MHGNLRRSTGYEDGKVNALARDVQKGFDAIIDTSLHKFTIVWNPPHNLQVPFFGGDPRLSTPSIVRCDRARNLTEPLFLTTPGGCTWEWVGNNQVRLDEVSGLINGHQYELVFTVVG
jgi:hypothetical protein